MRRDTPGTDEHDERFAAFVRSRGDHHLRTAVLLTGSRQAGEDLLQTSLLKLYRAWPRLDVPAEAGPEAYLRRIMVNTWRSWWRTRWWHEEPVPDVPERTGDEDPADRLVVGAAVREVLAMLPKRQRAVLVLRYFADLPEAEVAMLLGCTAGTVKTHAYRGLRTLRVLLAAELPAGASADPPRPSDSKLA